MSSQRKDPVARTGTSRVANKTLARVKAGSPKPNDVSNGVSALRLVEIRCFRFEGRT